MRVGGWRVCSEGGRVEAVRVRVEGVECISHPASIFQCPQASSFPY